MADPAYIVDGVLTDPEAWVALASTTLTDSLSSTVTFTSSDDGQVGDWSQYMDLVLIVYARGATAATDTDLAYRFGTTTGAIDSGSNYIYQKFRGDGSSTNQSSAAYSFVMGGNIPADSADANIFGASVMHLFDINSGKYKTALILTAGDRDGSGWVTHNIDTWEETGAMKRIDCFVSVGLIMDESRYDLFGVLPRMVS